MSGSGAGVPDLLFWILMALMAGGAVALLFTTREWLNSDEGEGEGEPERGRGGRDMAVYRDQLREFEADLARGLLGEAEAASARLEVERRLLAADRELGQAPQPAAFSPGRRRRSLVALMVFIPAAALGLYLLLGSPELPGQPFDSRSVVDNTPGLEAVTEVPDIAAMVARLAARLLRAPEDLEGWKMLAQSYLVMERPIEAQDVLWRGLKYFPGDPDLLLTTARLEMLLAQEAQGTSGLKKSQGTSGMDMSLGEAVPVVPSEAARLFERLIMVMPDHGEALWMAGLAEVQAGNRERAAELWRRLLATMVEDSGNRAVLEGYLAALEKGHGPEYVGPK